MNETSLDGSLVSRIRDYLDERKAIADALKVQGPVVVERLLNLNTWETSLRQLARDTDVSPTYLSRIHRGQLDVSPGLFLVLSDLLRKRTGIIGLTGRTKREQAKGRCLIQGSETFTRRVGK